MTRFCGLIFDMDGVLFAGERVFPGAPACVAGLRRQGMRVAFLTNNSGRHRREHCAKLRRLGFEADESEIVSSASVTAQHLRRKPNAEAKRVYVIGGSGLAEEIQEAGLHLSDGSPPIDFVVVGMDVDFTYEKLTIAQHAILNGAEFIATNADPIFPTEDGPRPGGGTIVAAVQTAAQRPPDIVVGKPQTFGIEMILEQWRLPTRECALIGDQLATDILAGNRAGLTTIMVTTGINSAEDARAAPADQRPDHVIKTLAELPDVL